ncbi:MAG: hypothetical protein N0C89_04820 [Candidatus Thiodiazotropha endolucinida]|nr:hypothetical protein [Candidatus Thiodiazotropha endolucinida]MCW4344119.1 hypothetical protein [Candidatus Thiodiazotropha endolucinida]MCW4348932.1 hypothetical protein [Candidatus Thiodiazotropha endolucinida]
MRQMTKPLSARSWQNREALKGKPQRRHAALERYRLMCTDKAQTE